MDIEKDKNDPDSGRLGNIKNFFDTFTDEQIRNYLIVLNKHGLQIPQDLQKLQMERGIVLPQETQQKPQD